MNPVVGYIYIRSHASYDIYDVCKIGKTSNIPERDSQYATGEIKRGFFEEVFEIIIGQITLIERLIQNEFRELNITFDAGTEFYDKKIITLIEPYLIKLGIKYKKLSKQNINDLLRRNRIRNIMKKINVKSLIRALMSSSNVTPRTDQITIIEKSVKHFQKNDKGLLVLICGIGKTLISLWITQRLNLNTILIGVPNKLLLKQWSVACTIIFQNIPFLIVSGGNTDTIIEFLENNRTKCIVITTYASSHKVYTATQSMRFVFDMKINDECHHLTSCNITNSTKTYIQMLNILSVKQISLTATLKQIEDTEYTGSTEDMKSNVISNDSIEYFGKIIDRKCLLWAIDKNIICDYVIQVTITDTTMDTLYLGAFASLKSIFEGHSHHLLIYSNNKDNSLKLIQYIKMIVHTNYSHLESDLYYSNYHSELSTKYQKEIINNFTVSKFGIISCVYCLGEGWDFPLLDGVVFAENMTSNIRIVQSALRASRKNKNEPNKIAKIILPISSNDLTSSDNSDLKKIKEVIYQMSLEDETIVQKVKVFRINLNENMTRSKEESCCSDELTKKLILKTIKRTTLVSYEKAKKILADKNIKSKEEYYLLCHSDIRLPEEPELTYKNFNWIDYLSIKRIYYDLNTCRTKVREYLLLYPELKKEWLEISKICDELCKIDPLFPPSGLWTDYYNLLNLDNVIVINVKKKIPFDLL
jgi:superfamily II DNA or RNA helicase